MTTQYIRYPSASSGVPTYPLLAPDGTVSAPSYSFTNSTTTGIYSSGANIMDFAVNGLQAAEFSAASNTLLTKFFITDSGGLNKGFFEITYNSAAIFQIAGNAGVPGYLQFSENSIADYWSIGVQNADTNLYFRSGAPGATIRATLAATGALTTNGITLGSAANTLNVASGTMSLATGGTAGITLSSAQLATLGASGGTNTHVINGKLNITFPTASASQLVQVLHSDNTSATSHSKFRIQNGGTSGGNAEISYVTGATEWLEGVDNSDSQSYKIQAGGDSGFAGTIVLKITTAGVFTIGTGTTARHRINGGLATNGAQVLTMTNGPTGTSGNPAVYLQVNINGTNYVIPAWAGA